MLHNSWYKCMLAICDRICLTLSCMAQETVDQDWTVRCHTNSGCHIFLQRFRLADNLHTTSAKDIRWTNHNRITDLLSNSKCFLNIRCHASFWHRDVKLLHHCTEEITILCHIDNFWGCTKDTHAVLLQVCCQIQRCLSTELCNDAHRLLLLVDRKYIFECQWLKIQFIRCIVICRNRLRVTVYDDCLKSKLL